VKYPSPDNVDQWDDASLFAAAASESALRYDREGFEALNDIETSLCCLYLLEAEVNNGGFGQWINTLCPGSATETPRVLQEIGATDMAAFVAEALLPMGDLTRFRSKEEWIDHYLSLPDEVQEHLETLTELYLELENRFMELVYAFTRDNWQLVRTE